MRRRVTKNRFTVRYQSDLLTKITMKPLTAQQIFYIPSGKSNFIT
ncbi:MAG: hypothetical protein JWR19_3413 [Pedosphaera sp.]|nr:hypothetical protein [Pedosphaera sp.]